MKVLSSVKCFGGVLQKIEHQSAVLGNLTAKFNVFLPPGSGGKPVVYYLSGLTCTEDNFAQKAHAFQSASERNLIIVAPDTSPRGAGIPGEDDSYDLGTGAGFYVNATMEGWKQYYHMYDYVTQELLGIVNEEFDVNGKQSIMGHSMGGHGALVCYLKNPGLYKSVSAFSPIVNPVNCPWGEKAFTTYLGPNKEDWKAYDATELVQSFTGDRKPILIDQGASDNFLVEQLKPENFEKACQAVNQPLTLRMQEGYDHSYYFIQSFMQDHIKFHADALL